VKLWGRKLECLAEPGAATLPVYAVRPEGLDALLATMPDRAAAFLRDSGFAAAAGSVALVPGGSGAAGAVLGLGGVAGPWPYGALPYAMPEASICRLAGAIDSPADAVIGFCMGAYRFDALKSVTAGRAPARLVPPDGTAVAAQIAETIWLVRDLINLPANYLGPAELAEAALDTLRPLGADIAIITGEKLAQAYPLIDAVGRGSIRPPHVVTAMWRGRAAIDSSPLISLCGKGVCFDTGGNDLKPSAMMLRMKKDMGGAAVALGLARLIILADLPVRLELRLGCVENSLSGSAMRPMDVLRSRRGLSVTVGNTDAEGRLVLADLLAEASDRAPDLLLDFATLTGAARVALGPDIAALFSNDDNAAEALTTAARMTHDPVWRLPLYDSYNYLLESYDADLNNVSEKPYAGAIVAGLFLQRFVASGVRWIHLDLYAWNDGSRVGRPEGGEAHTLRSAFAMISRIVHDWDWKKIGFQTEFSQT
jgi:leucyl aminopeptidase